MMFSIDSQALAGAISEEFKDHLCEAPQVPDASFIVRNESPVVDRVPEFAVRVSTVFPGSSVFAHSGSLYIHEPGNCLICVRTAPLEVEAWVSPEYDAFEKLRYLAKHLVVKSLEAKGLFWIHGSAVSPNDGGALIFTGVSGSGKTTCLLAMLEIGYRMVSDDVVLVRGDSVLPFYLRSMIHAKTVERFPTLRAPFKGSRYDPRSDGSWINLGDHYPVEKDAIKPAAIFNTFVWKSGRSVCRPSNPEKTVQKLVRNFILESGSIFEPSSALAKKAFEAFSRLAESVPCFDLYIGTENPPLIEAIRGAIK